MADQDTSGDRNEKNKKGEKEPPIASLVIMTGQVKNRQVPVTVFVSLGKRELISKEVHFYVGHNYNEVAVSFTGTDGRAATLINIPTDAKGSILVAAKAEGMTLPVYATVDISEEEKPQILMVDKLDIEPTGQWYDDEGASHGQWTPRVFDANGKAVEAKLHIVGARPFKINGLTPPVEVENKIFDITVSKEIKTYEVIVASPGLLEVDVFVDGADIEDEFMLEGARPAKQPGFFTRRYLERRERRG